MLQRTAPTIRKASFLEGKTLTFRDARPEDATFILSLRTDPMKSRYLSPTLNDVHVQTEWLRAYANSNDQAYFIIHSVSGRLGTVRLYDAHAASFCWGSWILKSGAPRSVAIESALMVYAYATDHLGFHCAHFDVRKANERVWKFHERFGGTRIGETELDYVYIVDESAIQRSRAKYVRFLPNGIAVTRGAE